MLPEARLELMIRALCRKLGLSPGRWAGEDVAPEDCDVRTLPWAEVLGGGAPFVPAPSVGFLRRVRSVFVEDVAGPHGLARGGSQVLEMAVPARHGTWTVSVLPVGLGAAGQVVVGIERRLLPAAQLGFGDAGLPCVPAWRVRLLPEAPDPLRAAAASAAGCAPEALTRLGAAYHPSLGLSPERVQPFAAPIAALPGDPRRTLRFVRLAELLGTAASVRDGHLLVSAFRMREACGKAA